MFTYLVPYGYASSADMIHFEIWQDIFGIWGLWLLFRGSFGLTAEKYKSGESQYEDFQI